MQIDLMILAVATLFSLTCCAIILVSRSYHLHRTARGHDRSDVQALHRTPTPRIGGGAVLASFACALVWVPVEHAELGVALLLSAFLLLVTGLREDLNFGSRPRTRLAAALFGSLAMALMTRQMIGSASVPFLDPFFALPGVALAFTVLAGATMAHSVNLIDGLNGLAGGYLITHLLGLASVALMVGDPMIMNIALLLSASLAGFLVFNFPYGKIFLGDAGAYVCGHAIAWLSILLLARNPEVSAHAVLLMALWPLSDLFSAIWRRVKGGRSPGDADRLHFHHLVFRIQRLRMRRKNPWFINALSSVMIFPLYLGPVLTGVMMHNAGPWPIMAIIFWIVIFIVVRLTLRQGFRSMASVPYSGNHIMQPQSQ